MASAIANRSRPYQMKPANAYRYVTGNAPHLLNIPPSSSGHANLVGLTTLAGRQHISFTRLAPANSLRNKRSRLTQRLMHGSRSNRSCVHRALGIQPRGTEFGGMNSLKKSRG